MGANITFVVKASLAIFLALAIPTAMAQLAGARQSSETFANAARAQNVFDQYKLSGRRSAAAEAQLIEILNLRLPRSEANTIAIRNLLASPSTPNEQIGLIRLLATQYERGNPTGKNQLIIQDLRVLSASAESNVARAATFAFTRLGYLPGFEEVLGNAFKTSMLTQDEYFGEIAHVVAFAPSSDQARLARALRQSKNSYAAEIVAMQINSAVLPATWSTEARGEIGLLLEATEPVFPQAAGLYDLMAAVRYANWLNALATVRASVLNKEGAEFILNRLNDPGIDSRKVMAFLDSEYGPKLFQLIGEKARFRVVFEKISLYSNQHPQSGDMKEAVAEVAARLNQMPR